MSMTIQDIDTKRTSLAKLETELRAEKVWSTLDVDII